MWTLADWVSCSSSGWVSASIKNEYFGLGLHKVPVHFIFIHLDLKLYKTLCVLSWPGATARGQFFAIVNFW
jgi:hypothetical protein